MVQLFIEAKKRETSECVFLETLIRRFVPDAMPFRINPVDGWTNLCQMVNVMTMQVNQDSGGKNLVIFDADSPDHGGGYEERLKEIKTRLTSNGIQADLFLWPDNRSDGTVEDLMLGIARKELHPVFFDCFEDYEKCLAGVSEEDGTPKYHCPDLKSKVFTYISSMPLSNAQRRHLGGGNWLFDNPDYWDLESDKLDAIAGFLRDGMECKDGREST